MRGTERDKDSQKGKCEIFQQEGEGGIRMGKLEIRNRGLSESEGQLGRIFRVTVHELEIQDGGH